MPPPAPRSSLRLAPHFALFIEDAYSSPLTATSPSLCWPCSLRHASRSQSAMARSVRIYGSVRFASTATNSRFFNNTFFNPSDPRQRLRPNYFLSNHFLRANATSVTSPTSNSSPPDLNTLPPHRRRQALKRNEADQTSLPLDASARLANAAAQHPSHSLRRKLSALLSLSKPRLTVLVVLSAMVPYALYPVPSFLSSAALDASTPSLSPLTLLFLTTGTALCSASANALNMLYEPDTDAKMSRTRARPLVRGLLTTRAAVLFAILCGLAGTAGLYWGVNPTVSFLGAANIVLYAGAYTPLKRISAINTWVGAIVGGIPPLMGWAAAAGENAVGDGGWRELLFASDGSSLGGWLFAGLLFAWQFPHFMPLSWGIREEYKAAGLRMLCWINPARNARVALRWSIAFIPLCFGLCLAGVTEWSFAVTSTPVNLWLVREAVRFWRFEGHKGSARALFWASVWHLPVIMVLALVQKKGLWARVWRGVVGTGEEEFEEEEEWAMDEEEEEEEESVPATTVSARR